MLTYPTLARPSRRTFSLALPLVLLIAACGSAAAPSRQPTPDPSPNATPTAVPGTGAEPDGGAGAGSGGNTGGGTDPGNPGIGIDLPFPLPQDPADDPLLGDATQVVPVPGRLDPHPVNVQLVRAAVDGDDVWVEMRWYSGIEECYATDSVQVDRDDEARTIKLTVIEGSTGGDAMCIEIAVLKATAVNLGDLAAGTWTISATGDAPSFDLEVR